jgi:hypothetical protein
MNYSPENDNEKILFNKIINKLRPTNGDGNKYPDTNGDYWTTCPIHGGKKKSLVFNERGFMCEICQSNGNLYQLSNKLGITHPKSDSEKDFKGVTLEDYASAYKLPPEFLKSCDVSQRKKANVPRVLMPFYDFSGKNLGTRVCSSLNGSSSLIWKKNSKIAPYGLWKIRDLLHNCRKNEELNEKIIFVEHEVDAQILWFYGFPAICIPDQTSWKPDWIEFISEHEIYVWQSPGLKGKKFVDRVSKVFADFKVIQPLKNVQYIRDYHLVGNDIPGLLVKLFETAIPFSEILDEEKIQEIEKITELAKPLMNSDVLDVVVKQCKKLGVVGEERTIKLLYLILR